MQAYTDNQNTERSRLVIAREDQAVLKDLARQVAHIASNPLNDQKRELWKRHNALKGRQPPIFISPDGAWDELLPRHQLVCRSDFSRQIEFGLRQRIIREKYLPDDVPIEKTFYIEKAVLGINQGWGLEPKRIASSNIRGAWQYAPVIRQPSDWKRLQFPRLEYDEKMSRMQFEIVQDLLGPFLDIELTGIRNFSFHMLHIYCDFRGLQEMMIDLVTEPVMVHEVMAFLCEGLQRLLRQVVRENLVALNNNDQFHYTGGLGYTDELPAPGFDPARVRLCDIWGAAEAQELAGVSPEMHREFALTYEKKLLEPFGLNGYGCCEPLTEKIDDVLQIPNLRRISISPWADVAVCAARLQKKYIMSWKPQPAYLAHDSFDTRSFARYIETELEKGRQGYMEIVLRDTHTCRNDLDRFRKFVQICRQAIDRTFT